MALIGYARVSTEDQTALPQTQALTLAGCSRIHEEQASGGDRGRPVLARALERIERGDTLVVVRIDRLARSLSHLLEVIERLEAKGAFFRSLTDPIDTTSPQGKFTLQVLGAAAEFERALIRERTMAGLAAARSKGRIGGNPGLRRRDPEALRKIALSRTDTHLDKLAETAPQWVPIVRRLRPMIPWQDVVRTINGKRDVGTPEWTADRLVRSVRHYVANGFLPASVLERAPRKVARDSAMTIIAAIKGAEPEITLKTICERLEALHEPTPRGRSRWHPSSVQMFLDRARAAGLLPGRESPDQGA